MAEPQDFPTSPDGSVTALTWAEGGVATEPSAGRKATGTLAGDVLAAAELNWLSQSVMQFSRASWARGVRASDAFFASWFPPTGNGVWSTDGVGPLEGFLSDDPLGVNSIAADMFLDPDDAGAVRVQVVVGKASPATFPATRDTYVFVPIDMLAPPLATLADLQFIDVPIGNPAPATPVGFVAVWRVETDGATIVDQEILLFQFPILKDIGAESLGVQDLNVAGMLNVGGVADFSDAVNIDGVLTCNDDINATSGETTLANTTVANLDATGLAQLFDNVSLCTGVGNKTLTVGTNSLDGATFFTTTGFNSMTSFVGGVSIQSNLDWSTGVGVHTAVLGSAAADSLTVNATTDLIGPSTVSGAMSVENSLTVLGGSGGSISSDPSAVMTWNGNIICFGQMSPSSRLTISAATSLAAGDLSRSPSNTPRWHNGTATNQMHISLVGHMKAHGQASTVGGPAATVNLDTSVAAAPVVAADLDVAAEFWIQRAVAGDVIITLNTVGVGQIGGNATYRVNATGGNTWDVVTISRTRAAADTTARVYRLSIDGNGQNITVINGRITATTTS